MPMHLCPEPKFCIRFRTAAQKMKNYRIFPPTPCYYLFCLFFLKKNKSRESAWDHHEAYPVQLVFLKSHISLDFTGHSDFISGAKKNQQTEKHFCGAVKVQPSYLINEQTSKQPLSLCLSLFVQIQ